MTNKKSDPTLQRRTSSLSLVVAALLFLLPLAGVAGAQSGGTIDSGMSIAVRTNEEIKVNKSDGRVYSGEVEEDVRDTRGQVALSRGSHVELMVRSVADNEYSVDLESVSVDGRRLAVDAGAVLSAQRRRKGLAPTVAQGNTLAVERLSARSWAQLQVAKKERQSVLVWVPLAEPVRKFSRAVKTWRSPWSPC